jgi:hypothetical protein
MEGLLSKETFPKWYSEPMRRLPSSRILFLLCLLVLASVGCKKQAAHSEMFVQIFKQDAIGTFRGIGIGTELAVVKQKEITAPKHDDQWGYVYEYSLGGKNRYVIEYLCRDPQKRSVNAIVLNVLLEDKAATTDLFAEMESDLRSKYGVADGNLGNLKWRQEETNLMVSLRMLDDKKSISLNYGALQAL